MWMRLFMNCNRFRDGRFSYFQRNGGSHELTPKEKEIWMLFDRVDVAELLARDAFAKGAYMLGAEDREIMLK